MRLTDREREKLSKKMAGLLRHYGPKYGLRLDEEGWAKISDLVKALHKIPGYEWVSERHVVEVVVRDEKGRYELKENRIRARYGHSLPVRVKYKPLEKLPPVLYHGTVSRNLESIMEKGLVPMKRRYVHLSYTWEDAYETGRRHGHDVVVIEIDASCLKRRRIPVYHAGPKVAVTPWVPPDCIRPLGGSRGAKSNS